MTKIAATTLVTVVFAFTIGCSPGFVDKDCNNLDRYSSSNWITKAFCKLGNLL